MTPIEVRRWSGGALHVGGPDHHVLMLAEPATGGGFNVRFDGLEVDVHASGDAVTFVPAGLPWQIGEQAEGAATVLSVFTVPGSLMLEACGSAAAPWRLAAGERRPRIADTARRLGGDGDRLQTSTGELVPRLLCRLIGSAFGSLALRADDSWLPAETLRRIEALCASGPEIGRLSVPLLAKDAGLGVSAFSRGFRGSTGLTPGEYLLRARLGQAAHLLGSTDLPVSAIAGQIGLAGASHLVHQFARHFGTTPGTYRAVRRSGPP